ncbi:uncharacterized protein SOCG_03294 [Schizosaccharomyces octosporus yFS286]|uniref:Uncharacterized protein n=1 Tax=Schizosaccharomyces octosporus (strain yFS286) TaxID=483514 RepID=S9R778_SCHOY|nr:uncharacterized protein SOCG_03294 [Schizosaccharomyces octosporus yFS286]EPX74080.1 hypothetical protein SOCG_03294 [Schizosaccharomyces octosporus yFS286]
MFFNMPQEISFKTINTLFESTFSPFLRKSHLHLISQKTNSCDASLYAIKNPSSQSFYTAHGLFKFKETFENFSKSSSHVTQQLTVLRILLWKAQVSAGNSSCLFRNNLLKDLNISHILSEVNTKNQNQNVFLDLPLSTPVLTKREVILNTIHPEDSTHSILGSVNNSNCHSLTEVPKESKKFKPALSLPEIRHELTPLENSFDPYSSYNNQHAIFIGEILPISFDEIPRNTKSASLIRQPHRVLNYEASVSKRIIEEKKISSTYLKKKNYAGFSSSFFPFSKNMHYINLLLTFLFYIQLVLYSLNSSVGLPFTNFFEKNSHSFYFLCEEYFSQMALYFQHCLHSFTLDSQLKDCSFLQISQLNLIKVS